MGQAFHCASVFQDRASGVEIWLQFNDANRRIQNINWTVPAGIRAWARVWVNGVLQIEQSVTGPVTGASANVAGNRQMVQQPDGSWDLPPEITYDVQIGTA